MEYTALCRIKAIPTSGFGADPVIACHWVGLTLPCLPTLRSCYEGKFFEIPQMEAINILQTEVVSGFHLAEWYKANGYPQKDIPSFYIPVEFAEFVREP